VQRQLGAEPDSEESLKLFLGCGWYALRTGRWFARHGNAPLHSCPNEEPRAVGDPILTTWRDDQRLVDLIVEGVIRVRDDARNVAKLGDRNPCVVDSYAVIGMADPAPVEPARHFELH
jgi:hypothetical protein